jgi:hypothetical protein
MPTYEFSWPRADLGLTWVIAISFLVVLFVLRVGSLKLHRLSKTADGQNSPLVVKMETARRYLANEVTMTGDVKLGG